MAITCPECGGKNVRMSKWKNRLEQLLDLFGMPPMRCGDCNYRWKHSLWRLREIFFARCPRCYQLKLAKWEETYYHIPKSWQFLISLGAKKVRCKACRHNFISFRFVKGVRKWIDDELDGPVSEVVISLSSVGEIKPNQTPPT